MAGQGVHQELYPRAGSPEQEADWRDSPWFRLIEDRETQMRRRLALGEGTNEFPLLASLADKGGTDYWARIMLFGDRARLGEARGIATSWTDARQGCPGRGH